MINGMIPLKVIVDTLRVWKVNSATPIVDTIDDSLIKDTNSFPNDGQIDLNDCGKITFRIVVQ